MTTQTHPTSAFWDKMARKYSKQNIGDMASYEATLDRTRSYLKSDDKVLEIGAGTSSTALLLAPLVGHYTSSDYSAEMVEIGREKLAATPQPNLEIVHGAPGDASVAGEYDVVMAFNLLHLLPDLDDGIREAATLVRPGGLFISKTPCIGHAWYMKAMIAVMKRIYGIKHVLMFTAEELESRIKGAGFAIVEADSYTKGRARYIVARKVG